MSNIVQGLVWKAIFPNPIAKLIAVKLSDWADDDGGTIYPAAGTVAKMTGCGRSTVIKWQQAMEHCGLLKVIEKSAGGSRDDTTERAFDLELLQKLIPADKKTPAELTLVEERIERTTGFKNTKITVFKLVPTEAPSDAAPVYQVDRSDEDTSLPGRPVSEVPVYQVDPTSLPGRPEPFNRNPLTRSTTTHTELEPCERVCAKWGKLVEEIWTEEPRYRYVVELLVGPLHARKQRAKGIEVYPEFLRSIRDGIGERDFSIGVLQRAAKALDENRTVMPALPEVLAACERAGREHQAETRATEQSIAARAREAADPGTSSRTEALRERLRHRLGRGVVDAWFDELVCERFADGCLTVSVGPPFKRSWIKTHFAERLAECAEAEFPGMTRLDMANRDAHRRAA